LRDYKYKVLNKKNYVLRILKVKKENINNNINKSLIKLKKTLLNKTFKYKSYEAF
jgi:hypothetical protein